jgi:hypothetical protein
MKVHFRQWHIASVIAMQRYVWGSTHHQRGQGHVPSIDPKFGRGVALPI